MYTLPAASTSTSAGKLSWAFVAGPPSPEDRQSSWSSAPSYGQLPATVAMIPEPGVHAEGTAPVVRTVGGCFLGAAREGSSLDVVQAAAIIVARASSEPDRIKR